MTIAFAAMALAHGTLLMGGLLITAVAACWLWWAEERPAPVALVTQQQHQVATEETPTMHLERITLPGVGTGFRFSTRAGKSVGVVRHHDGRRELVVYAADDPDTVRATLALTEQEAQELADVLGAHQPTELAEQFGEPAGVTVAQLRVPAASPVDGRAVAQARAHDVDGAVTVVAVIRGQEVHAGVGPDFVLRQGDLIITAGSHAATIALHRLIANERP